MMYRVPENEFYDHPEGIGPNALDKWYQLHNQYR